MTDLLRRAWYFALGALAVYAWHRIRKAEGEALPAAEPMVSVMVTAPASKFADGIAGFGAEMGAIFPQDNEPPSADGDDDAPPGLDPGIWGGMNGGGE